MASKKQTTNDTEYHEKLFDLKKVKAIIRKNFIVLTRDKVRLIPLLIFPIVMMLVLGSSSGNTPKHISTAIVVQDNSQISQDLQQAIQSNQVFSITRVVSTEGEARRLLDLGDVRVIIEIPPNLQNDIDAGVQRGIVVIVDESDSAIAATSKQALNTIINNFAHNLAMQQLTADQRTVDDAANDLDAYITSDNSQYDIIKQHLLAAQTNDIYARGIIAQNIKAIASNLPSPSITTPSIIKDNETISTDNTYVREPASADGMHAQIASLDSAKKNIDANAKELAAATQLATTGSTLAHARKQTYEQKVIHALNTVHTFTKKRSDVLLKPLTYEEKPAYGTGRQAIDFLIPSLIALTIFQGAVMNMGRSVVGEKREGSLTRVFLTPTSNTTILSGTLIFYVLFELCRAAFLIAVAILLFNIKIEGSLALIGLILIIYICISTAVGMILSSMVKTEPQYMALAMVVSMPTMFLAGAFFPIQSMPSYLQGIAAFIPATYAGDALRGVMVKGFSITEILFPVSILLLFLAILILILFKVFKRDIE